MRADQKDWAMYLDVLEFHYKNSIHSATGYTPFELATGKEVITPLALVNGQVRAEDVDADTFLLNWQKHM